MTLSFRQKLLLAMMLLVSGVTAALLWISERQLNEASEKAFDEQFRSEAELFQARQEGRLGAIKASAKAFTSSIRFTAWLHEWNSEPDQETAELFYDTMADEFGKPGGAGPLVSFFRIYDGQGELIADPVPEEPNAEVDRAVRALGVKVGNAGRQAIGYLPVGESGKAALHEVLVTPFVDPHESALIGHLVIGTELPESRGPTTGEAVNGVLMGEAGELPGVSSAVIQQIQRRLVQSEQSEGTFQMATEQERWVVHFRRLTEGGIFPASWQVSLHSMRGLMEQRRELRWKVAWTGAAALGAGLVLSLALAHGLAEPVGRLVQGTQQIEKGNYGVKLPVKSRDEIGRLTESFNQMAGGLLLKEKYRSVLDMVADKQIAEDLINGRIELGGEERVVSVLFCDIRGFTALTERMAPQEVITMLNDHFTPLTRIVYEHHGVVDKFVGDLIMAIFGAPKSFGNDAENAARCALKMIAERQRLNAAGASRKITMGIGIASGTVVAGRMGSKDRLNYTVLGPKVNLASRLCGQAGSMEVVIDEETLAALHGEAATIPMPELKLKGFAAPIQAFKLSGYNTVQKHETLPV